MTDDNTTLDLTELHWRLEMLQNIDVGLVVLDRDYRIQAWNSFMESHSGTSSSRALGCNLFELFPEIPADWLRQKVESVFLLNNPAFTIWEQRPYLFRFRNYRPITGVAEFMYQNTTLIPLCAASGEVSHVCLIVYDVTDVAVTKLALTEANAALERLSRTDRLTGLYNRGHWEEQLEAEFRRCRRTAEPASLVMFDIDHFKRFNDDYGHQAGDEVLRQVAQLVRRCVRETDIAGRYGGEEFAVILVGTQVSAAGYFAERLRKAIEKASLVYEGQRFRVTVSLGVAELAPTAADRQAWIEAADQALYAAKAAGRNRVSFAEA